MRCIENKESFVFIPWDEISQVDAEEFNKKENTQFYNEESLGYIVNAVVDKDFEPRNNNY